VIISYASKREVLKIKFWYPKDIVTVIKSHSSEKGGMGTVGFHMALKNTGGGEPCPRCGKDLVVIESKLVKWLNCPSCKFKKLVPIKDRGTIRFTPVENIGDESA